MEFKCNESGLIWGVPQPEIKTYPQVFEHAIEVSLALTIIWTPAKRHGAKYHSVKILFSPFRKINNMKGEPMTQCMLRGAFDRARIAGIKAYPDLAEDISKFQFRDLRAKAGTDKKEEQGMAAAQAQLGHSSPKMTGH